MNKLRYLLLCLWILSGCTFNEPECGTEINCQSVTLEMAVQQAEQFHQPVCLIGIDALTWDIVKSMIQEGKLPNLKSMIQTGASGILEPADDRLFSPRIWTSMATGKTAEKHGITHFLVDPMKAEYSGQTAGSDLRDCLAIWNIVSHFGKTVLLSNYMVSWPAEQVRGTVISDYFYMNKGTWPESIGEELSLEYQSKQTSYAAQQDFYLDFCSNLAGKNLEKELSNSQIRKLQNTYRVYLRDQITLDKTLKILKSDIPDLAMIYLRSTDIASHYYWKYSQLNETDSRLEGLDQEKAIFGNLIPGLYQWADESLGRIIDAYPDNTTFIVVSDHGFQTHFSDMRVFNLIRLMNDLTSDGSATRKSPGEWLIDTADPIDAVRRISVRTTESHQNESSDEMSLERDLVQLQSKLTDLRTETGKLMGTLLPVENVALLKNEHAPTIAFQFNSELVPEDKVRIGHQEYSIERYVRFLEQSGNHAPEAMIIIHSPDIEKPVSIDRATALDMTPTMLALLGLPVGRDMDGKVLVDVFDPLFREKMSLTSIETYEGKVERSIELIPETERPRILQELRSIGYIQ